MQPSDPVMTHRSCVRDSHKMKFKVPRCLSNDMDEIHVRAREIETGQARPRILKNPFAAKLAHMEAQRLFEGEELP